jgi:KTSC domain
MAKQIVRQPLNSSMLRAVGYDPEHAVLQAEYQTGQTWNYLNVPQSKFDELLAAESHGRYMHAHILGYHAEVRILKKKKYGTEKERAEKAVQLTAKEAKKAAEIAQKAEKAAKKLAKNS